ncbi:hypothetical protein EDD11_010215 [Mortierella claussenii]|nr:hypothetical protein EDD11_010215 [Mortierella claussenii]
MASSGHTTGAGASSAVGGGDRLGADSEGGSQFWSDFWNTLYQFTHPFSSTFFDSLLETADQTQQDTGAGSPPSSSEGLASGGAALGSDSKQHFKDQASFQKFWDRMHAGTRRQDEKSSGFLDHTQAAWIDFKSSATEFISSVEWQQTWIQSILALHLCIFVTIVLVRNRPNALASMFFSTILLAALSEPLNGVAARHWQLFSDDNYFDSHGVFTSIVWAGPLLCNSILAVLLLLRATAGMLIKVKRAQLQETQRKKQK